MKDKKRKEELKQINFKEIKYENSDYNNLVIKLNNIIKWGVRRNSNTLKHMYWDDAVDEYKQNKIIIKAVESTNIRFLNQNNIDSYYLAKNKIITLQAYFNLVKLLKQKK